MEVFSLGTIVQRDWRFYLANRALLNYASSELLVRIDVRSTFVIDRLINVSSFDSFLLGDNSSE